MKKIIIFVIMISLFIFSFDYDKNFNYDSIKNFLGIEYDELKKIKLNADIIDLTKEIKWDKISLSKKMQNTIFPIENKRENYRGSWCSDYWKLRKYDKDQILELYEKEFSRWPGLDLGEHSLFPDLKDYLRGGYTIYCMGGKIYTVCFNKSDNEKLMYVGYKLAIIDIVNKTVKKYLFNALSHEGPIINILGEYVFYMEIIIDDQAPRADYCCYILHRVNLKTLEDEYIDFSDYGIYQSALGVVDGFMPIYDISLNKRYFYFYGESDKQGLKIAFNDFSKFNDGLYVYDWWENKLYKVGNIKCNDPVMITNNIDDGYIYLRIITNPNTPNANNYKYDFYRTKNFESLLDEYR
jgi:hypothetical protein